MKKKEIIISLILSIFLVSGCGKRTFSTKNSIEKINQTTETKDIDIESSKKSRTTHADKIKIILAEAHKEQLENPTIHREVATVQEYFDNNEIEVSDSTLNFVFIGGEYHENTKKMTVIGVFVNTSGQSIYGFDAKLVLSFKNSNAKIDTTTMSFPPEFLGELSNGSGVLLHFDIPVQGLTKDEQFKFNDIQGVLTDIETVVKQN